MSTTTEPRTEAGRECLADRRTYGYRGIFGRAIAAIEDEAIAIGRREMDETLRLHAESPEHYPEDFDRLAALVDCHIPDGGCCSCGKWDTTLPLTFGAHVVTELQLRSGSND